MIGRTIRLATAIAGLVLALLPSVAAAQSYVYWDNPATGFIGRADPDGQNVDNTWFNTGTKQLSQLGVAVDGQYLYWTNGGWIGRATLDKQTVEPTFIRLEVGASTIAVDNEHIYWAHGTWIGRANLDGTGVLQRFILLPQTIPATVDQLAVDSRYLYWADPWNFRIGRASLDGTGVDPSFITGAGSPTAIAVDGEHLYWADGTGKTIGRADLDGGQIQPNLVANVISPQALAVDLDHVWWTSYYHCDYKYSPPVCEGGTLGRANLDGSEADRELITAEKRGGPGCGSGPSSPPCGPHSVAVSAPTEPACLRLEAPPRPPPGGAVLARPLDAGGTEANVVVLPPGVTWTSGGACDGVAMGADDVMSHPTTISVAPGAALRLTDDTHGLKSAWGARGVSAGDPAPGLFPGRPDWQTTAAEAVKPAALLGELGGCPACTLPDGLSFTPRPRNSTFAYQGDLSGAALHEASLGGDLDGFDLSGAQLGGAHLSEASVSGTDFSGADLRGAQLDGLTAARPPSFANVRVGLLNGSCTAFTSMSLLGTGFDPVKADVLVPGCETTPLFPATRVPFAVLEQLAVTDGATIDFAYARFVVTGPDSGVLAGADLSGITLDGARFEGFPADFEGTIFDDASLQGTSFQLADLGGATFRGASAAGASFTDARLSGVQFTESTDVPPKETILTNADFASADVSNASFESADISGAQFDGALAYKTVSRLRAGDGHQVRRRPHLRRRRGLPRGALARPGRLQQRRPRRGPERRRLLRLHQGPHGGRAASTVRSASPATSAARP